MNWKWGEKESVRIEDPASPLVGVDLSYRTPAYGEIKAFEYGLEKARRVYITLEKAKDSYEGGRAAYQNATEEVKHLIDETNKAALELIEAMDRINGWFESPVSPLFKGDADGFMNFCMDWIKRQGPTPEVQGNSSREPSANFRKRLPKIAATVKGSSSGLAVSPVESGSGRTNGSRRKIAGGASTS